MLRKNRRGIEICTQEVDANSNLSRALHWCCWKI